MFTVNSSMFLCTTYFCFHFFQNAIVSCCVCIGSNTAKPNQPHIDLDFVSNLVLFHNAGNDANGT